MADRDSNAPAVEPVGPDGLPSTVDPVAITALGSDGDGLVAPTPGSAIWVPRALPGEHHVRATDGSWQLAGPPSPARRAAPLCPHFPACGGCTVQHMGDAIYQQWKAGLLVAAFAKAGITITPEAMISAPLGSRRRASLSGRRTVDGLVLGFHVEGSDAIVPMTACAVLAPPMVLSLPLLARIGAVAARRPHEEVRLSLLLAREGLDVTLSATRKPDGPARTELAQLVAAGPVARLTWNGEVVIERARPTIIMSGVSVSPPPAAFLQAAAHAETAMAAIVSNALPAKAKRAVDLFAGLGTFAYALAPRVQVEAFEGDRRLALAMADAVRRAQGLKPVTGTVRDLFRDPLSPKELDRFDLVVLDPPRAGAKAQAEAIAASKVRRVVAVSCNPATLARDVAIMLAGGFRIERLVPIDQFHFTPHLEAVAVLGR